MAQGLTCTLCGNHCPLNALGCLKGQRFYEKAEEPYCPLCENHCLLTALQCSNGAAFFGKGLVPVPVHPPAQPDNLIMLFEVCAHQFSRVRGGLSGQMRVLRFLHNHGDITQREMQEALCIKSAAMSELISRLEDKGLIVRTQSIQDKRKKVLGLTAEGERVFSRQARFEEHLDLFSPLTLQERRLLESILLRLNHDWRNREDTAPSEPELDE